ncbi:MAG: hypothetical protein QOI88_1883 [Gammaproteobacteria bacterium]|jgi:hypothetical protein|nr:hypothetical protein [Gammaproteobacteria bacterium]
MTPTAASCLRTAATVLSTLIIVFPSIWGGFALWYQIPGGRIFRGLCVVLWGAFSFAMLVVLWQGGITLGVIAFAVALAGLLLWWTRLQPTNDHEWADDVARITTGTRDGNRVTLQNVRNFDWRTETDYTQRWETRSYDLNHLRTVDMIMSYWGGPAIAHMLISFGFDDGAQVVFSVEVRRQKTQAFSEIGGFFNDFELSIIAADERDVVRLRTNVRGEDVYLYRLQLPQRAMRLLFLGYVGEANRLVDSPRFYNTITVNCTTLVYQMMNRIVGRLPLDYRLLFSGYLPGYVYRVGGLNRRCSLEELRERGRIVERAKESDRSESFSADIRRGIS